MKIKTYLNNLLAIIAIATLVGGFQISTSEQAQVTEKLITIDNLFGVEEAYAGPCGSMGCVGQESNCGGKSHTLLWIGDYEVKRYCKGIDNSEDDQLPEAE